MEFEMNRKEMLHKIIGFVDTATAATFEGLKDLNADLTISNKDDEPWYSETFNPYVCKDIKPKDVSDNDLEMMVNEIEKLEN